MSITMAERLAEYVISHSNQAFPEATVTQAKRCLMDSIGVAIAGSGKTWAQQGARLPGEGRWRAHARSEEQGIVISAPLYQEIQGYL